MKKIILGTLLSFIILSFNTTISAQTLFVPGGIMGGLGTSTNTNVGIGTNSPSSLLDVNGTFNARDAITLMQDKKKYVGLNLISYDGLHPGGQSSIQFFSFGGHWSTSMTAIKAGTSLGSMIFTGFDGNETIQNARLEVTTTDDFSPGNYKSQMRFRIGGSTNCCGADRMVIDGFTGRVGIGLDDYSTLASSTLNDYKLYVGGGIVAEEIRVKVQEEWPDYVFATDYKLPTLEEVESFIKKNKHLSGVPSAATVSESGVELAKMNKIQIQKIEELTLYTIQQEKQLNLLSAENEALKKRLAKIEAILLQQSK